MALSRARSLLSFLLATFAAILATLALAAPAGAALVSTWSVNATTKTATWTEATDSAAVPATVSISPGPTASPADDRLVSTWPITGGGCVLQVSVYACPLGNGTVAYDTLVATFSGNLSPYTINVDLDRPGLRMRGVFTLAGGANPPSGTFNGSATTVGPIAASGFGSATGGEDDDALTGNDGQNTLTGGPGDDALSGLKGNDTLIGGPGDDALSPGLGATEIADGGEGSQDTLSAAGETGPVNYSLDGVVNDGLPGQTVTHTGIENLTGTDENDTLLGDAGFNHIYGGAGNDAINGGGGGHDVLRGNAGDDALNSRDASALFSDVACSGGTDSVIVDAADLVASDCENVDRAPAPVGFVAPAFPGGPTTASGAPAGAAAAAAAAAAGAATSAASAAAAPTTLSLTIPKSIKRKDLRSKGLRVAVGASQAAEVTVELVSTARAIRAAVPKDNVVLARSVKKGVTATQRFTLKPDASLARGASSIAVRITAVTSAGVRTVERRSVKLR